MGLTAHLRLPPGVVEDSQQEGGMGGVSHL